MWKSRSSEALATILVVLLVIIVVAVMWNFASALMCQTKEKMDDLADVKPEQPENTGPRDAPDPAMPKFVIYHWARCEHCKHIMNDENGSCKNSVFTRLKNAFDKRVAVYAFEVGVDPEAGVYNAFPVIKFIAVKNGKPFVVEYESGDRSFEKLQQFIQTNLDSLK